MGLKLDLERQGNFLFRWRSYLPLLFAIPLGIAIANMQWPFHSYRFHEYWECFCIAVSFSGLLVRVVVVGHTPVGTSGRNTYSQIANTLNTTGAYSAMRHPLYLGNWLIALGAMFVPMIWWLPVIYTLAFWLYYERIMIAEEAFLTSEFGEAFTEWAARTPAFIPTFKHWVPAALPFSFRNVLRREYTAFAVVVGLHAAIEVFEHLAIDHRIVWHNSWAILIGFTIVLYFGLRFLKKKTDILKVAGR